MRLQGGYTRNIFVFLLILLIIGAEFFYLCLVFNCEYVHANETVVINEVVWMGTGVSANDEWIELYNTSETEVDLTGWRLVAQDGSPEIELSGVVAAGGYYLLERSDDESAPFITADLIYTGALGNSGEILELLGGDGVMVDLIDASEGWPAGDNTLKQSMERALGGLWQSSEIPGGTPGTINSSGAEEPPDEPICGDGTRETGDPSTGSGQEECDDGNTTNGDGCSTICKIEDLGEEPAATSTPPDDDSTPQPSPGQDEGDEPRYGLGSVLINEFVSDPQDEDVEWIELYNTTNDNVNLSNWTIEEGSGAKTTLSGTIGASGNSRYIVIEKPKGNLNNKGDIIILRFSGALIDQVAYGDWDDGNTRNNAPAASDPSSVARKLDGYSTHNNQNDFVITTTLTKGGSNIITELIPEGEGEVSAADRAGFEYSKDIVITEIMPNPIGDDSTEEFIELFNTGERDINLAGWWLGDESTKRFDLGKLKEGGSTVIKTGGYLVVWRADSKIALNNTSDTVKLWQPLEDSPFFEVRYEKAVEGESYNLGNIKEFNSKNRWAWSETVTPGEENIVVAVNHTPVVDFDCPETAELGQPIIFDSSDTVDEDGDTLRYSWDFGDGFTNTLPSPEHTFFRAGAFSVHLGVHDGIASSSLEKIIVVGGSTAGPVSSDGIWDIVISEFVPNPEGRDEDGEWIEIMNNSNTRVNLLNWSLDDIDGGSRPFTFTDEFWLEAGQYFVLDREESGLALNNSLDEVRIISSAGEVVDAVKYIKSYEGEAYARGENDKWFWTSLPTPDTRNIITLSDSQSIDEPIVGASGVKSTDKAKDLDNIIIETTLTNLKDFEVGDRVKVKGTVAVLPGIFGTQYFYIVGSPGVQVYSYKKDFPTLMVGDYVEVSGELALTSGERRLKTKVKEDIKVLDHMSEPLGEAVSCGAVNEEIAGQIVTVTGEVVEQKSSSIYLDDGSEEVLVYIKTATGINPKTIKEGEIVAITGIVNRTSSGVRVMPRSREDIVKKDIETTEAGQVLGEIEINDEWVLVARDKKIEFFQYLLVAAGAIIFLLLGLLFKIRKAGATE